MKVTTSCAAFAIGALSLGMALPAFSQAAPAATPMTAPAPAAVASAIVVIPFGEPGAKDGHLADATNALTKDLQTRGIAFTLAPVQPHADVATSAATLCTTYKGSSIIAGSYKADQTNKVNGLALFMPIVLVAAGTMNYAPTHTVVKLDQLDCTGAATKHAQGESNLTHHGQNADSTVVDTIVMAMQDAVTHLTGVAAPDASPSPTPAP
ncbi:MAG: hypothetical protein GIW98_05600 [Candidatus Eremiobacteraeota bacterium]|nr:hypothetical protein [Candidatus Eremiobacteraeota bacterium]